MVDLPKLSNDCFALPQGVHWTPVKEALAALQAKVKVVTSIKCVSTIAAGGRVLAEDIYAARDNPPYANSAVDGYGFAHAGQAQTMALVDGRGAAGVPYSGVVPTGKALRILTGAAVPAGVDTIVLEEDVDLEGATIRFAAGLKHGANLRPLGEDIRVGDRVLKAGRILGPQDLALLASAGIEKVNLRSPLRVGVLSTGDEIRQIGEAIARHQIYDANRPMLLDLVRRWGMTPVDLGHVRDDAALVGDALTKSARLADVVLTTGGASAGDEDHISAALRAAGALNLWRIALKPGRPLALGMWDGVPVFGLPGNPVAAFVTALIFAHPTLQKMSGAGWSTPHALMLPAGFSKSKKAGRQEYLRAKIGEDGRIQVFKSEGSGRVSSISWARGLVRLEDGARDITPGDPVAYIPFSEFGI